MTHNLNDNNNFKSRFFYDYFIVIQIFFCKTALIIKLLIGLISIKLTTFYKF